MIRLARFLFALLLLAFSVLTISFSAEEDFPVRLSGNYEIWSASAYNRTVCFVAPDTPNQGHIVIPSYVDQIAFDLNYIFAQHLQPDKTQYPPISEDSNRSYHVVMVDTGGVLGPMTEAEFDAWYATLGRSDPPQWISTGDQPALIDRWEALHPGQTYE